MFLLSQIVGIIAIIITIISLNYKDKDKLLFLQTVAALLKVFALYFVGGISGAIAQIVGLLRKYTFFINAKNKTANSVFWLILFITLSVGVAIFTWEGIISLLPMFGTIGVTYALWQDDPVILRYLLFTGNIGYGIYSTLTMAYTNALSEVIILIATAVSLVNLIVVKQKTTE